MIKIEKILFPTDFSEFSAHALKYAVTFAREYEAKIIVLHVVENYYTYPGFAETAFPMVELYSDMEKHAEDEMASLVKKDIPQGIQVETVIKRGTPFREIVETAKEKEANLIIIATHGRTGLEHAFFGSTAEKVVRKAPCPVLTVRGPEAGRFF